MSGMFTSIFATSPLLHAKGKSKSLLSAARRVRPVGVDAVFCDRLGDALRRQKLIVGQRLQARHRRVVAVDLEERTEPPAVVRAAETVRAENLVAGGHIGPDSVGKRFHVVG